jgi:hypothetical protein
MPCIALNSRAHARLYSTIVIQPREIQSEKLHCLKMPAVFPTERSADRNVEIAMDLAVIDVLVARRVPPVASRTDIAGRTPKVPAPRSLRSSLGPHSPRYTREGVSVFVAEIVPKVVIVVGDVFDLVDWAAGGLRDLGRDATVVGRADHG